MKCIECENTAVSFLNDPRDPPLDTEPCLCPSCHCLAANERIDELEEEIVQLRESIL